MALSEQDVFVLSERTLSNVIDKIQDQQWDQTTPDWFQTGRQDKPTLRAIINYHAYDSAWVPDVLAKLLLPCLQDGSSSVWTEVTICACFVYRN